MRPLAPAAMGGAWWVFPEKTLTAATYASIPIRRLAHSSHICTRSAHRGKEKEKERINARNPAGEVTGSAPGRRGHSRAVPGVSRRLRCRQPRARPRGSCGRRWPARLGTPHASRSKPSWRCSLSPVSAAPTPSALCLRELSDRKRGRHPAPDPAARALRSQAPRPRHPPLPPRTGPTGRPARGTGRPCSPSRRRAPILAAVCPAGRTPASRATPPAGTAGPAAGTGCSANAQAGG